MTTATLLRRHGPSCSAGHPQDSFTTEAEERRKGAKRCRCRIYAGGTLDSVYHKLATKQRDWDAAREVLDPYLQAGRWDLPEEPPPDGGGKIKNADVSNPTQKLTPIKDAVKQYLSEHETAGSAKNTILHYKYELAAFERYSDSLGLRFLEEWTTSVVRQFRASWKNISPRTAAQKLSDLKTFFEIFVEDEILDKNPARIKTRRNRALRVGGSLSAPQKNPYTDSEIERMLQGCRRLGRLDRRTVTKKEHEGQVIQIPRYRDDCRLAFTGEDLADFIQVSFHSGLRIGDVATFHIDRLTPSGHVKLRATKNGNWVTVWIPVALRERLQARARRFGPLLFGQAASADPTVLANSWRRKLIQLWKETGPWKEKPTHHRFRHTFARILLQNGASVGRVAELMGDTEQMILRHYSAWMPERQAELDRMVEHAFRNAPRY